MGQLEKRVENEAIRSLNIALYNKIELPQDYFKSVLELIMYSKNRSKAGQADDDMDKELDALDVIVCRLQQLNAKVQANLSRVAE